MFPNLIQSVLANKILDVLPSFILDVLAINILYVFPCLVLDVLPSTILKKKSILVEQIQFINLTSTKVINKRV